MIETTINYVGEEIDLKEILSDEDTPEIVKTFVKHFIEILGHDNWKFNYKISSVDGMLDEFLFYPGLFVVKYSIKYNMWTVWYRGDSGSAPTKNLREAIDQALYISLCHNAKEISALQLQRDAIEFYQARNRKIAYQVEKKKCLKKKNP